MWLNVLSASGWIVAVAVWFLSRQNGAAVVLERQETSGRGERPVQPPAAAAPPAPPDQPAYFVFGEARSRALYNDLRTAATPTLIEGIWCSSYPHEEIMEYFRKEAEDLRADANLRIRRIINPDVLHPDIWYEFTDLWRTSPRSVQDRWNVFTNSDLRRYELFFVQYALATGREATAALICNDVGGRDPSPELSIRFDPERDPRERAGVHFVRAMFDEIAQESKALTRSSEGTWDAYKVARAYDDQVWKNPELPDFFEECKRREQALLLDTLTECGKNHEGRPVTFVEIGCGTGRALLEAALPELHEQTEYLIGFDSSWGMLKKAEENLREELFKARDDDRRRGLLKRVAFCSMDAGTMDLHFREGTLVDEASGTTLAWRPEGAQVDPDRYRESQKVFGCMLNTLGVIPDDERHHIVANMVNALGKGDYLVMSVFNGERFAHGAAALYPLLRGITQARDETYEHFDEAQGVFSVSGSPGYFSRWFFPTAEGRDIDYEHSVRGMVDRIERESSHRMKLQREVIPIGGTGHFIRLKRLL